MAQKFWLMKSEPDVFSFEDLKNAPNATTHWDGVRNYQARNFMRDEMQVGDLVLYYHSNYDPPGVVGIAEVVKAGYPDHTAWDPASKYHDPKSTPDNPRWFMVDIKWKQPFKRTVTLQEMKQTPELEGMKVTQRGMRLSVQPVDKHHFDKVVDLAMTENSS